MATPTICELAQFDLVRFSGTEAQAFLHNQLTCDVAALTAGSSTYGSYCTPKGRVLATFLLWRSGDDYFMQLPSSLRDPIQKQLSKYILRAKVKAADASSDWTLIGVAGKDAAALVKRVAGDETVIRIPGERYEIAAARGKAHAILAALASETEKVGPEFWDWLDIRAGVPVILPATREAFVPQMVNLDLIGGVSLTKGCYPGQEIVARMHYRGTLKQRMYLANIAGSDSPQPGDKLYSPDFGEQACGTIVNAARSPESGSDVLAVMQIASAGKGNVHWKALTGPSLKLMPLPYSVTDPG